MVLVLISVDVTLALSCPDFLWPHVNCAIPKGSLLYSRHVRLRCSRHTEVVFVLFEYSPFPQRGSECPQVTSLSGLDNRLPGKRQGCVVCVVWKIIIKKEEEKIVIIRSTNRFKQK